MTAAALSFADDLDARITASRRETKFLLTHALARKVAAELDRQLAPHCYRGEGANRLPGANHYVTTIYFDTEARSLFQAVTASATSNVKLRAKEYYDLHPDLIETATDARQLVRFQPVLWLELKHRDGMLTGKRRVKIPKADVPGFFADGTITPEMLAIQRPAYGGEAARVLAEVAALCATCTGPMRADCLVNYRRLAWQDATADLRVTIDSGLASFAPPDDLWQRQWALVRPTLGPAITSDAHIVLEIKSHGDIPRWLTQMLEDQHVEPTTFSKFEAASRAIHGSVRTRSAA